jgi:hypothetical protein
MKREILWIFIAHVMLKNYPKTSFVCLFFVTGISVKIYSCFKLQLSCLHFFLQYFFQKWKSTKRRDEFAPFCNIRSVFLRLKPHENSTLRKINFDVLKLTQGLVLNRGSYLFSVVYENSSDFLLKQTIMKQETYLFFVIILSTYISADPTGTAQKVLVLPPGFS